MIGYSYKYGCLLEKLSTQKPPAKPLPETPPPPPAPPKEEKASGNDL